MKIHWSKASLAFLFIVALIGTLLRSTFLITIPFEYQNLIHAHSHVAFQGWIYTLMMLLLTEFFLKKNQISKGRYPLQFKLTIVVIIGVLVSFSLQGYGLYSITVSTMFQFLNYWFVYSFLRDTKLVHEDSANPVSLLFVKTGLWLGLLSTLLPVGIGVLSAKGLSGTEIYNSFIYTFLHLQYNGWFLFVALGFFYKFLESNNVRYNRKNAFKFYLLFTVAVIPAIALSFMGLSFSNYVLLPAYIAAGLQWLGLLYFLKSFTGKLNTLLIQKSKWIRMYLLVFLISFYLKVALQCLSAFPGFKEFSFHNKSVIIAYLHLSLIGVISFLFLGMMIELKWLKINRLSIAGSVLLISGFLITESLLVLNGLALYFEPVALSIWSFVMVLGILCLMLSKSELAGPYAQAAHPIEE